MGSPSSLASVRNARDSCATSSAAMATLLSLKTLSRTGLSQMMPEVTTFTPFHFAAGSALSSALRALSFSVYSALSMNHAALRTAERMMGSMTSQWSLASLTNSRRAARDLL